MTNVIVIDKNIYVIVIKKMVKLKFKIKIILHK